MDSKDILLNLPTKVNTKAVEGMSTVFHFDLSGEGGGQVTLTLDNGNFTSKEGLHGEPKCVIKGDAGDLKKMFKGELNPMMAILTGKIKISNQLEMLQFAKLFNMM